MSTFDGFFREFDGLIRADRFDDPSPASKSDPNHWGLSRRPLIYLLSHAHTDHLVGLDQFSGVSIYCSAVTKDLVLRLSKVGDRMRRNVEGSVAVDKNIRTYHNLCTASNEGEKPRSQSGGGVDLLHDLPLNTPRVVTLDTAAKDKCCLTLIDANHCPGSVMFLIQMRGKNVLYTGDIRAEPWWVDNLCKMPFLAPFLGCFSRPLPSAKGKERESESFEYTPLDNIYLDTASFMCRATMAPKCEAIEATLRMMEQYPPDTVFFLNAWTWGYEELLERVAVHFRSRIHVDEYKAGIYKSPAFRLHHPLLRDLCTTSVSSRFHACDRYWRCRTTWGEHGTGCFNYSGIQGMEETIKRCEGWQEQCVAEKRRIVNVNPWEMELDSWKSYEAETSDRLQNATESGYDGRPGDEGDPWPAWLASLLRFNSDRADESRQICPLARHSSFPELHRLVSIFRPRSLFPNTIYRASDCLDFRLMATYFGDVLYGGLDGARRLAIDAQKFERQQKCRDAFLTGQSTKPVAPIPQDDMLLPTDGVFTAERLAALTGVEFSVQPLPLDGFMWSDHWVGSERTKQEARSVMRRGSTTDSGFADFEMRDEAQPGSDDEGGVDGMALPRLGEPGGGISSAWAVDPALLLRALQALQTVPDAKVLSRPDVGSIVVAHPKGPSRQIKLNPFLIAAAIKENTLISRIAQERKAQAWKSLEGWPAKEQLAVVNEPLSALRVVCLGLSMSAPFSAAELDRRRLEIWAIDIAKTTKEAYEDAFFAGGKGPHVPESAPPVVPLATRPLPRRKVVLKSPKGAAFISPQRVFAAESLPSPTSPTTLSIAPSATVRKRRAHSALPDASPVRAPSAFTSTPRPEIAALLPAPASSANVPPSSPRSSSPESPPKKRKTMGAYIVQLHQSRANFAKAVRGLGRCGAQFEPVVASMRTAAKRAEARRPQAKRIEELTLKMVQEWANHRTLVAVMRLAVTRQTGLSVSDFDEQSSA